MTAATVERQHHRRKRVVAPDPVTASRRERLDARQELWGFTSLPRIRDCGRAVDEVVTVRQGGAGSGFGGLSTCGSVWSCPFCSAKISAQRSTEVTTALARWLTPLQGPHCDESSRGNNCGHHSCAELVPARSLALVTLTMRHHKGQSLAELWDALSAAWRAIVQSRTWKTISGPYGQVGGYLRVTEVTHGANGWHVHLHVVLFLRGEHSALTVAGLGMRMFSIWQAALVRSGLDAPGAHLGGVDSRVITDPRKLGPYLAKAVYGENADTAAVRRAGAEVAGGVFKGGRLGNRTPFQLLASLLRGGDGPDDLSLWWEWEKASKGRRQVLWSRHLRADLGIGAERTDEELAADADEGAAVAEISRAGWSRVCKIRGGHSLILDTLDRDGPERLFGLLDELGVDWHLPDDSEKRP
jgi:hypothetical protein